MDASDKCTTREFAKAIGTSAQRVGSWIRQGMPTAGRNGVYSVVFGDAIKWCVANGKVEEVDDEPAVGLVVANRADVARHFGVNEHTVSGWQRRPGFPGRPATPGRRDGYYPIDEIEKWREETILKNDPAQKTVSDVATGDDVVKSERARLLGIQCSERELRLAEKRGEFVSVDEVTSLIERLVNQSSAILDELPDRVLSVIPHEIHDAARRAIRDDAKQIVRDIRATLSELQTGDEDDEDL